MALTLPARSTRNMKGRAFTQALRAASVAKPTAFEFALRTFRPVVSLTHHHLFSVAHVERIVDVIPTMSKSLWQSHLSVVVASASLRDYGSRCSTRSTQHDLAAIRVPIEWLTVEPINSSSTTGRPRSAAPLVEFEKVIQFIREAVRR